MNDIKIYKGADPERYAISDNFLTTMMQVDYDNDRIIIGVFKNSRRIKSSIITLFDDTIVKFNDEYQCSENGTYDFLLGFKMFIKNLTHE